MKMKYFNGEKNNPYPDEDIRSNFWYGEMMFVTNHQDIDGWKEEGKNWLTTADDKIKQLASKYTPEQFGVITYISALFSKWCPYDDQSWIVEY